MGELSELIRQKKEIEAKIQEIRNSLSVYGKAKIGYEHFPTIRPDEWYLSILSNPASEDLDEKPKYRCVIRGRSKRDVVDKIPSLIADLQGLYENSLEDIENAT